MLGSKKGWNDAYKHTRVSAFFAATTQMVLSQQYKSPAEVIQQGFHLRIHTGSPDHPALLFFKTLY